MGLENMERIKVRVTLNIDKASAVRMNLRHGDELVAGNEDGLFSLGVNLENRDGSERGIDTFAPEGSMESRRGSECKDMILTMEAAGYDINEIKKSVRMFWLGEKKPSFADLIGNQSEKESKEEIAAPSEGLSYTTASGAQLPIKNALVLEFESDKAHLQIYKDGKCICSYRPMNKTEIAVAVISILQGYQPPRVHLQPNDTLIV